MNEQLEQMAWTEWTDDTGLVVPRGEPPLYALVEPPLVALLGDSNRRAVGMKDLACEMLSGDTSTLDLRWLPYWMSGERIEIELAYRHDVSWGYGAYMRGRIVRCYIVRTRLMRTVSRPFPPPKLGRYVSKRYELSFRAALRRRGTKEVRSGLLHALPTEGIVRITPLGVFDTPRRTTS